VPSVRSYSSFKIMAWGFDVQYSNKVFCVFRLLHYAEGHKVWASDSRA
jgi:hypothetical protein